ncbi:TPA: fimbrial biogenesis outer membrane usher protein [Klebsiella quasipneumoniae subsp. similipneumoniae]|nr:fimbrial biogenesis outer membrane usher protein [Klebsiella quasipneumoniae subsp. similipneumoniae]
MKNNKIEPVKRLGVSPVACFVSAQVALFIGLTPLVNARDHFNPALLELGAPDQQPVDLSAFESRGGQLPGIYHVDVYINNDKMETRDVEFRMKKNIDGKEILLPCLSVDTLDSWGIITKSYPSLLQTGEECANILAIPQSSSNFIFERQRLLLSFPQSAVRNSARGWVDPANWDEGIPAFLLNYRVTGSNNYVTSRHGEDSNTQYMNLRPGVNIGPWRLRNYTTWSRTSTGGAGGENGGSWKSVYSYAQRNIISLKSQFKAGDSSTDSDVFDSVSYRGVALVSDDEMLPDSLKGYAPVVRGIARTNAKVTIRQNGYIIYEDYVSPGAFEINDMFPTGGSGDLNVTITESDGSVQNLVIPFASLPVLQREGQFKYNIAGGLYRSYDSSVEKTPLMQLTAIYGLPQGITLYGGGQFSKYYNSTALGVGKNLGNFGALSTDVTQAWSTIKNKKTDSGQSWRLRYSKNFTETGTNFAIAGYRYATNGYWGMQEVLNSYHNGTSDFQVTERRRNRAEISVSQQLIDAVGNISLNAVREDYYNSDKALESYAIGYFNSWNSISYGINYSYNINSYNTGNNGEKYKKDQIFSFNINVPFSFFGIKDSETNAGYSLSSSKNGGTSHNFSLSGTALEQRNLNWSIQKGYGSGGIDNNGSINTYLNGTYGEVNAGYNYDTNARRLDYGISGGIIAHENGITFGQQLGETVALVAAPHADGVAVLSGNGVRTDIRGYAIVPYVSPYRKNDIMLDTETFGDNTDIEINSQTVIPTRGAVVRATYKTSVGYRVLMNLTRTDNTPVPFGAVVTDNSDKSSGGAIVGDGGQVYIPGLMQEGRLLVKWGSNKGEQCSVNYRLPSKIEGVVNITSKCL